MIITSYQEWRAQRFRDNPEVECPRCAGIGLIHKECPRCGADEDEVECEECGGDAFLPAQDVSRLYERGLFPVREYTQQLVQELSLLAEWLGEPVEEIVISAGLVPYTRIAEKQEYRPGCEPRMQFVCWKSYGLDVRLSEEAAS